MPGGINVKTPEKQFTYQFDTTNTLEPLTRSKDSGPLSNTTTVTAQADMTIGKKAPNHKEGTPVPYTLKLTAKSDTGLFSPNGYATATGADPQFIDTAGVFGGMLLVSGLRRPGFFGGCKAVSGAFLLNRALSTMPEPEPLACGPLA